MSTITKEQVIDALKLVSEYMEQDGGAVEGADAVTIPTAEEIEGMDLDALTALAGQLSINIENKKEKAVKKLLTTFVNVATDAEVDETDLDLLAEALGLTPDAKMSKTLAAVKEWIDNLSPSGEASTEGEAEATEEGAETETETAESETESETTEAETTEGEAEATEGEAEPQTEESEGDNVDREAVAAKVKKFPDDKTMLAQLTAYNAKAETKIAVNPKLAKTIKPAYLKLLAELVSSSEEVSAWGVAYVRDSAGWCCGLPLADAPKPKGEKRDCGKCVVTGALFAFDEEKSEFIKLAAKK